MTARTLLKHFPEITREQANTLSRLMSDPYNHEQVDRALEYASSILGGCGIAAIEDDGFRSYYCSIGCCTRTGAIRTRKQCYSIPKTSVT